MYGCGEQEVGVASGSGWNLWVWLLGVVVRRYIDFLLLLIPTPLVSVLFYSSIPTFCSFQAVRHAVNVLNISIYMYLNIRPMRYCVMQISFVSVLFYSSILLFVHISRLYK